MDIRIENGKVTFMEDVVSYFNSERDYYRVRIYADTPKATNKSFIEDVCEKINDVLIGVRVDYETHAPWDYYPPGKYCECIEVYVRKTIINQ